MSSKWSFGLVECSFVNLIERASKKIEQFLLNVRKWWEKNIFDRKNFYHKMLQRTDRQQFWRHRREVFVGKPGRKSLKFQWWAKKRIFSKKNLFNRSPWQVVISFDKTAICFPTEKPFIFRSMFEKDEKTYRKISKQMFVFKVILRTLRKQCRHLAEKKIDQRLINLRSMSKNNGEKYLRKIFSLQTGQIDKQKAALTTDRQVFVEMTYRSRSMPNDEKKNFSKKNLHKIFLDTW